MSVIGHICKYFVIFTRVRVADIFLEIFMLLRDFFDFLRWMTFLATFFLKKSEKSGSVDGFLPFSAFCHRKFVGFHVVCAKSW